MILRHGKIPIWTLYLVSLSVMVKGPIWTLHRIMTQGKRSNMDIASDNDCHGKRSDMDIASDNDCHGKRSDMDTLSSNDSLAQ